jgi:hypothetical protein
VDYSPVYTVEYYFAFLVKYKPLITRALGGYDAPHKSVSGLENGFMCVVDAHFIDKIEERKILDPSACGPDR